MHLPEVGWKGPTLAPPPPPEVEYLGGVRGDGAVDAAQHPAGVQFNLIVNYLLNIHLGFGSL